MERTWKILKSKLRNKKLVTVVRIGYKERDQKKEKRRDAYVKIGSRLVAVEVFTKSLKSLACHRGLLRWVYILSPQPLLKHSINKLNIKMR